MLLDGSGQMVDCIGFDPTLRELDVADDLAFLVMDLVARGGEQLAQTLVHAYRDAGGNPGTDALIAFFAANRALVRAKVALLRAAAQAPPSSAARGRQNAAARDLVALAERFAWRARLPLAIVVCGVPAASKSTLEWALAATSGLPHLNSDATRKQLAGIESHQRAPAALYSAEVSRSTHAELGQRARGAIAIHGGVLIDATFRHRADRDAFAAAFSDAAPVLFVECRAPARVLAERAVQRDQSPARVSDASVAVVVRERSSFDPLDEVEPEAHLTVRTDRPSEAMVAELVPCSMGASVGSRGSAHAKRPARDAAYGSRPRRGATMTRRATTRADEALIIVDLQQDFCPGGALAVGGADQIVGEINRLAAASPFVIATRDWHPPNHGSFASEGGPWPVHCVRDTPGAQLERRLDRDLVDVIVDKGSAPNLDGYSAFEATALERLLHERGVLRVHIAGLALDYCVKHTALDARALGFIVILHHNATRAVNLRPGDGEHALQELTAAGVELAE